MASTGGSLLKGRWAIWILALAFSLIAGFGVLAVLSDAAAQVTYYVVNTAIPAKTPITPDMLTPRTANADGVPETALPLSVFEQETLYTKVPLKPGDVVTSSVVGKQERVTMEIPAGYVVASLAVSPDNAVAGKIKAGDYIDIAAVSESEAGGRMARIVLHHVLVLDVTVAPATIQQAATQGTVDGSGPDSAAAKTGIPQLYTLAVSPENYAALALIRDQNPYVALSLEANPGGLDVTVTQDELLAPGPVSDAAPEVTDPNAAATDPAADAADTEGTATPPSDPAAPDSASAPASAPAPSDAEASPAATPMTSTSAG